MKRNFLFLILFFSSSCYFRIYEKSLHSRLQERWSGFRSLERWRAEGEIYYYGRKGDSLIPLSGRLIINIVPERMRIDLINPAGFAEGIILLSSNLVLFIDKTGVHHKYGSPEEFFSSNFQVHLSFDEFRDAISGRALYHFFENGTIRDMNSCVVRYKFGNLDGMVDFNCSSLLPESAELGGRNFKIFFSDFVDYGEIFFPRLIHITGEEELKIKFTAFYVNPQVKEDLFRQLEEIRD